MNFLRTVNFLLSPFNFFCCRKKCQSPPKIYGGRSIFYCSIAREADGGIENHKKRIRILIVRNKNRKLQMNIDDKKKYIPAISRLMLYTLPIAIIYAFMAPMLFDAPGSEKKILLWLVSWGMRIYPFMAIPCIIISMHYYKKQKYETSFMVIMIGVSPAIFGIIAMIFGGMF